MDPSLDLLTPLAANYILPTSLVPDLINTLGSHCLTPRNPCSRHLSRQKKISTIFKDRTLSKCTGPRASLPVQVSTSPVPKTWTFRRTTNGTVSWHHSTTLSRCRRAGLLPQLLHDMVLRFDRLVLCKHVSGHTLFDGLCTMEHEAPFVSRSYHYVYYNPHNITAR